MVQTVGILLVFVAAALAAPLEKVAKPADYDYNFAKLPEPQPAPVPPVLQWNPYSQNPGNNGGLVPFQQPQVQPPFNQWNPYQTPDNNGVFIPQPTLTNPSQWNPYQTPQIGLVPFPPSPVQQPLNPYQTPGNNNVFIPQQQVQPGYPGYPGYPNFGVPQNNIPSGYQVPQQGGYNWPNGEIFPQQQQPIFNGPYQLPPPQLNPASPYESSVFVPPPNF
uniref:Secretory calcium-binding phosphoprotein 5 n=1 Tax=Panagrellus redivivus TaxID=6233 RepID=A0A7E4V635_PANRE